jgi:LmbE family N-acetylglucosaminyl deacetylase
VEGGLLSIFAHPDDETFGVGGTMGMYADRGVPVTMVCATRGEVGEIAPGTGATPETLPQFREQELRDAMAVLGVHDVRFLDFRDSGMAGTDENKNPNAYINADEYEVVGRLVRIIRERKPEAIATWDATGGYGHPDHIAIWKHTTVAFGAAADAAQYPDAGAAWRTPRLYEVAFPINEFQRIFNEMKAQGIEVPDFIDEESEFAKLPRHEANCIIDVSSQWERKMRAMLEHRTQITPDDPFMKLPENISRSFFSREYFYRAHPELSNGRVLDDFLAD